ncbi:hypothetical protein DD237_003704 [Peronospora effusa]|uniref:KaiC-like domain-containing protein n=1 Tax=Peronospora effusa TaxID=542832 RepID=A0A425CB92_9STRA|nr:hypothetical protein DD237_003704 [Peronospora effusa]
MLHLEDFFTHYDCKSFCAGSNAPKDTKVIRREEDCVKEGGVLYLHGPKDAGQTSLLLQFGFTQVKAGKNVVLVMCEVAGSSPSSSDSDSEVVPITACTTCKQPVQSGETNDIWRRITIKYLRNSTELQQFLCSLHVGYKDTSVVLVDGFEKFFADNSQMGNVYQTMAFLLEAQDYMTIATGFGTVVVTGKTDAFLLQDRPLLRRWCRFLELVSVVEEPHVFMMREEIENKADMLQGCKLGMNLHQKPVERFNFYTWKDVQINMDNDNVWLIITPQLPPSRVCCLPISEYVIQSSVDILTDTAFAGPIVVTTDQLSWRRGRI